MLTIGEIAERLEELAPVNLAEPWDNVGLLVGDPAHSAQRLMTCLSVTPETAQEAIDRKADMIVTHHPLPFHALKSITTDTTAGKLLLQLIGAKIAVYSAHTAFDSAPAGINQHLAIGLGLQQIEALIQTPDAKEPDMGAGRIGTLGEQLSTLEMADRVQAFLGLQTMRMVGSDDQRVSRVAIACGSGGSFLPAAIDAECDCLVTGEATFHTCLEAEACGLAMILPGHFASERFAMISLADYLGEQLPGIEVWASTSERDPIRNVSSEV